MLVTISLLLHVLATLDTMARMESKWAKTRATLANVNSFILVSSDTTTSPSAHKQTRHHNTNQFTIQFELDAVFIPKGKDKHTSKMLNCCSAVAEVNVFGIFLG